MEGRYTTRRVLVVGSGWVGRQIAARLAVHGIAVWLTDRSPEVTADAIDWMRNIASGRDPSNASLHDASVLADDAWITHVNALSPLEDLTPESAEALQIDVILECVPEQLSLKKRVLRRISSLFAPPCVIASNSSYFVPSLLAPFVEHPARFAHMHFHVPVLRESVADIVGCEQTDPRVLQQLSELAEQIEQHPLVLRNEHPGYVFNWLLQAVLKAALELVALDVVDAKDVDRSWKAVTSMPLGPFGMMDQIGLDVIEQVLGNGRWAADKRVSDEQLMQLLRPLVQAGKLGVKSGSGFYDYSDTQESNGAD